MYVWHVCNKLQKCPLANKWCLRVIALHSRTWTLREQQLVSLHWCHARAVKWARNWKILKILDAPSDLHSQGKISVETHVATTAPKRSKEDQCLLTARDQLPKQVHFPLTLPCKCSWTERTHIASSKPQPGVRKAIAHCATAISTDILHYPDMSPRQQVTLPGNCIRSHGKNIGHSEWLPGVSKPGPFSSSRQSWRKERAIPFPNTNRRPVQEAVRKGHWKYTENPSSLVLSRLPGSGTPLRSFEKTDIPTACKKAQFLFLPSDLNRQGKISMETHVTPLRSSSLRKTIAFLQWGNSHRSRSIPHWLCLEMLLYRKDLHCLQWDTTWHQEDHSTLCHNPFHRHPSLPEKVTETTSNFTRGLHGITRKATAFNRRLPLHSLIEASSQVTIFGLFQEKDRDFCTWNGITFTELFAEL